MSMSPKKHPLFGGVRYLEVSVKGDFTEHIYKMDLLAEIEIDIAAIGIIYPSRFSHTELAEFYTQLSKLQTLAARCGIEKINDHYNICPWSNNNCLCGPDTFSCISANFTFHDLN